MSIANSRMFCALVEENWLHNPRCQAQLAEAIRLHKPVLLVVLPGMRLPETLAMGAEDLAVYRVPARATGEPNMTAAAAWIEDQLQQRRKRLDQGISITWEDV